MSKASVMAGVVLVPLVAIGSAGAVYQDLVCAEKVAYHRFIEYAQSPEGKKTLKTVLESLRSSHTGTEAQIQNLEGVLSRASQVRLPPIGFDCLPSMALGNETAEDIFDEYFIGKRSI